MDQNHTAAAKKTARGGKRKGAGRPRKVRKPTPIDASLPDEELGVAVLRYIAVHGQSEAARVSAARTLAARQVDDGMPAAPRAEPAGKKIAAGHAATAAAVGAYATPPPPRGETLQ